DLVLLVVDAGEGPKPQTWEHLAVVEQLRIPAGIPVITKADLVDADWLALLAEDLAGQLERSPVKFEPPRIVSAVTRQGVPELLQRLEQLSREDARATTADAFRMPVDRAFSVAGVGTVITGTPWSGTLKVGDEVQLLPGSISARVRSLEAYGEPVESVSSGTRAAVGLVGVDRGAVGRGATLVTGPVRWQPTGALDVEVELLPGAPPLSRRQRVRVHLGTAEVLARAYPMTEAEPERPATARLVLESAVVARGGDRFVLRSYSPVTTVGGGRVLDPLPPRRSARSWSRELSSESPAERTSALLARRAQGLPAADLSLLLGLPDWEAREVAANLKDVTSAGDILVSRKVTSELRAEAVARVERFHRDAPTEEGISQETLRRALKAPAPIVEAILDGLVRRGELSLVRGHAAIPGFKPASAGTPEEVARVVDLVAGSGLTPPSVSEIEEKLGIRGALALLRIGVKEGRVVGVESDRFFSTESLALFAGTVRELAVNEPVTPAQVRDRLGLSRKYVVPLLEWADREGITRRVGDGRVLV
ncbi:MAG: hypothetical protein HOP28_15335, partial [Gemmatimonadales bacterium]|nr:hypothetical protein [Gemmatimonadales bacterium]